MSDKATSKPDWKDAPEWARWMARDADGEWRVFENQPSPDLEAGIHRPNGGRHMPLKPWAESAEKRS
ncbi:hypothetical protein [Xanthomonas phage Olaya]|nr:hypothetical protein [Xanthomonas phage Olaya]QTZ82453.1 hypothetical protein [Xanthomonas phage Bolivar]QTZ82502.1 hypothetical protein [Xanthomonas phage Usaquen]QTZ82567.1 hypothetical protein [Xanthomonas phage Alcala]QTZ82620.1 hypothetical protein [Xanthomonas phage Fontebon]QTZ82660.1 hypothetical protein [Xanthomonas phage Soumapaz]CAA2366816.1 hypothetical protein [Xylella phage Usme]